MALNINGTTGISGVDGSASAPALQGTDSNTGINFGTDTVNINTGGTTRATVDSSGALDVPTDFPIKVNGSEKARLTSSGNFGINRTTPTFPLVVRRTDASGLIAEFANNGGYGLWIGQNSATGEAYLRTGSGQPLAFVTGGGSGLANERMRIDTTGRTILGSPSVNTSIANSLVAEGRIQSNGTYSITGSGGSLVRILTTGLLVRDGSSSRYKKDIANATWGLTDVLELRPVTFKSNATGENADDKTYGGFIAEDVHDIGLTNFVEYNDKNQPDAVHYGNMVALLTKAIQELNTKVTTLETKVAALEAA